MKRRPEPRLAGGAIQDLASRLQPASPLADVQRIWDDAVGPAIAAQAQPTAVRDGVVTVTCASATWAQELDLMAPELIPELNRKLGSERVGRLRCQAAPARSWQRKG